MIDDHADHAELSPSSSETWSFCADAINAQRGIPDVTSWEAAEGTHAHQISEECLATGGFAENYIGETRHVADWDFTWTEDDARLLQPGIDRIRACAGRFFGEHWVDLTEWLGVDTQGRRQGGTLDRGVLLDDGRVVISDLKYGRGVPVRPRNNKQLMLYALGFGREQGITDLTTEFILEIDQPRHMGGGGQWTTTWEALIDFGEWIRAAADATRAPNPPRTASLAGCMWCRAKTVGCATFDQYFLDQLMVGLDDLDSGEITMTTLLTPERRATLLLHRKMIETHLEHLYGQALTDALSGNPVGPMKAVLDRKNPDAWSDGAAAA